ncbi:MAG: Tol-Pal system beta propeller repeat protein TolB [Pseudomonadota bacterium]
MRNRLQQAVAMFSVVMFCLAGSAQAELNIEITQGVDNPIPVAVVPFAVSGATFVPEDIAQIVAGDLARSGQFRSIPRTDMLSQPSREQDVFYRDWKAVGSDYLVIGSLRKTGADTWEAQFQLHDVVAGKRMLSQPYSTFVTGQLRDVAHAISDLVYEKITGVRGAFSTKLLYVTVERFRSAGKVKARYGLQYADADGARAVTVLERPEPIMSPTWSPDGKKFAYVSFESGYPVIYVQDRATAAREKLSSFRGINGAPAWSPDGRFLAVTLSRDGDPEIYLYEFATRGLQRLTTHPAIDTEPSWSPDGKSLVFTSSRSGGPQIYRLDIASRAVQRLTFEGNYNARGRLLPDGRSLVVVHRDEQDRFRIAAVDTGRNSLRVLTDTTLDESPSVAPNGAMAIYATQVRGQSLLAAVSIDGRVKFLLPAKTGEVREPAWSPYL